MIHFKIKTFPPSTNKAYFVRQGRLVLSEAGRAYKQEVTNYVARTYVKELLQVRPNKPYYLLLRFYFEEGIETKGWQKNTAKNRYNKFDATNRVKLTEDALKDAMGVDDSQFMGVTVTKHAAVNAQGNPVESWFEAFIWSLEEERSPLDDLDRVCSGKL